MLLGTDGVNDPTITVYHGTDNTGTEVIPTNTYDGSRKDLNGFSNIPIDCPDGAYFELSGSGTHEVIFYLKYT